MKMLSVLIVCLSPLVIADEGTVWYDAEGEVAYVEGPEAAKVEEPFVPEWRKREIARRERQGAYDPGSDARRFRGYGAAYRWRVYRPAGWSVRRCHPPARAGFRSRGGVSVIIR